MPEKPPTVAPILIRRQSGGWLAISPAEAVVRIGVAAPTEEEATEKFAFSFSRWIEILSDTRSNPALDIPK